MDISRSIVRWRLVIALLWLVIAILLLPFALDAPARLEVGGSTEATSEAVQVDKVLVEQFASPFATVLALVVTGIPSPDTEEGLALLRTLAKEVEAIPGVTRVASYLDGRDPAFAAAIGTFVIVGISPAGRRNDQIVPQLREATRGIEATLRKTRPAAALAWTGAAAFDYDVRLTSASAAEQAERRVLPITLVLLLLVFGSVVAALCPLGVAVLVVGMSLGAAALISACWPMTILLQNIVSMVGLGIGIDYSLLLISRFREELHKGLDPEAAVVEALRKAGHTIVLSGGAVAIGFAGLLAVPATELRSIATGGLLVVLFAVLVSTTLLPAVLVWLGHRIERGRLRRARPASAPSGLWLWWGRRVAARPVLVLLITGVPLAALAWQAQRVSTDIPSGNWLPQNMESTRGSEALQRMGQGGIVQTLRVIVAAPAQNWVDTIAARSAVYEFGTNLAADSRIARLLSPPSVSRDGRYALMEVVPRETVSMGELMRFVRELRAMNVADRIGIADARIMVGGLPAHNADYQDAIGGSVVRVILLTLAGTMVALLVGLRSVLAAIKAVLLNLLSVGAAMGAAVLVFQDGIGAQLMGVSQPLDGLFPAVPIIVFCVVFGLSMDYEVFLLSRVAEAVRAGKSDQEGLVDGLARTGTVITSAALVMIIVFTGFALGEFLIIKILGFTLAVAIFIDATLVRLAIGPALLRLAGHWNWWPGIR